MLSNISMTTLDNIKKTLTQLSQDRCHNPGPFDEFTARLSELGVVRQSYDVITNEVLYYSKNKQA